VVFEKGEAHPGWKQSIPLATSWYANPSVLPYDMFPGTAASAGWYRFKAPPGLQSIEMALSRKPQIWVNGNEVPVKSYRPMAGLFADSLQKGWKAELPSAVSASSSVAVRMTMEPGYYGGAACPEPIRLNCGKGVIRIGNLFDNESLMTYSGGMYYRKTIILSASQAAASKIKLDLGELVASVEVSINGKMVGKRLSPPWKFDLTGLVKTGENKLEVLVYNTLGNYYLTTPSKYVASLKSGLIGPVKLFID
jgi:hypothetical protein